MCNHLKVIQLSFHLFFLQNQLYFPAPLNVYRYVCTSVWKKESTDLHPSSEGLFQFLAFGFESDSR